MPDVYELKRKIESLQDRLRMSLVKKVEVMKLRYDKCMASSVFKDPYRKINDNYQIIDNLIKRIDSAIKIKQEKEKNRYIELVSKLDALSPLKTLSRGYSLTEKDGKIVKSKNELKKGDIVDLRFTDGKKKATIN